MPTSSDDTWSVFSWWYLLEWVNGNREVVSFQGDKGTLVLMSSRMASINVEVDESEVSSSIATCLRVVILYITAMLSLVAIAVLVYAVLTRGQVAGLNLLEFNRVVGVVWVGRPLLALRGLVAICLLSTSRPVLVQHDHFVWIGDVADSWLATIVGVGEATWLLTVVVDVFVVFTLGRTYAVAPVAQLLAWLAVGVLQLASPVQHTMVVQPNCKFAALDSQITCISGQVQVGSPRRLLMIMYIIVGSAVVSYFFAFLRCRCDVVRRDGVSLPGIAQELYARKHWVIDGDWYVDRASALMVGLVSLRLKGMTQVLNVNTWSMVNADHQRLAVRTPPHHILRAISLRALKTQHN